MRRLLPFFLVALLGCAAACGKKKDTGADPATPPTTSAQTSSVPVDPKDPNASLFEQLSSGAFGLDTAGSNLEDALNSLHAVKPGSDKDFAGALKETGEYLDDAGASIEDFSKKPESVDAVKAAFAKYDDQRLKAIEAGNDALHSLGEAQGIVESLLDDSKYKSNAELRTLLDNISVAEDSIVGAIQALGGKVEEDQD